MYDGSNQPLGTCIFMVRGHGDLRIGWEDDKRDEVIAYIQSKMDAGVVFYVIDETSKARQKPLVEVQSTVQITDRQVFVHDADIARLIETGLANIATFAGAPERKRVRKAATAVDAAESHTIARPQPQGG